MSSLGWILRIVSLVALMEKKYCTEWKSRNTYNMKEINIKKNIKKIIFRYKYNLIFVKLGRCKKKTNNVIKVQYFILSQANPKPVGQCINSNITYSKYSIVESELKNWKRKRVKLKKKKGSDLVINAAVISEHQRMIRNEL